MIIQEAYHYAVSLPIKDFTGIEIVNGEVKMYLKVVDASSIELSDADSVHDQGYHFCMTTEKLLSDKWEVRVVK